MNTKNLIKKVKFRIEKDLRSVEGGGGGELPEWVKKEYSEEKLFSLKEKIKKISKECKENYDEFPIIIETELHEKALSKTSKLFVHKLFKNENFLGIKNNNKILYKLKKDNISKVASEIEKSNDCKRIVVSLKEIKEYEIKIDENLKNSKKIKIKLINQNNDELNLKQEILLKNTMKSFNLEEKKYLNNKIVFEVINNGNFAEVLLLKKLPFIEEVEEVIEIKLGDDFNFFKKPSIVNYKSTLNTPLVGLFDSGVNKRLFDSWCEEEFTSYIEEEMNRKHGNRVGSILSYGSILNINTLGIEGCKFISCVIGKDIIDETQLIINLEENLKKHSKKIKIWNLSFGGDREVFEDKFSDLAINLDILQKKYNVLFIKTTGNCEELENSNINCGAESLRSLTIGSVSFGGKEWTKHGKLSSFSKIGTGLANIVKPDLVYFGGDVCKRSNDKLGITVLSLDGNNEKVVGTSYAVPFITSYAAHIQNKIGGEFDPLLIKSLIIHNANYDKVDLDENNIQNKYGYGIPKNLEEIFYEDDKQITIMFRGKISKGTYMESLDIPYPKSLVKDGIFTGEIILTALIDPVLDGSQGLEYCQTDLNVSLGVYDSKKRRDLTKKTIKNEIGASGKENILNKSFSSKLISKNTETALKLKGKYTPTKKYILDLEKFTDATKKKLSSSKKWYLGLEPQYQLALDEKLKLTKDEFELDYCVLLTIKSKDKLINQEMNELLKLNDYNPVDIELKVNQELEIEIKG